MQKVRDVKKVTRLLHAKMQYPASLGSSFETYMVGNHKDRGFCVAGNIT